MEKKELDTIITNVLEDKADPVSLSPVQAEAMKRKLRNMIKEESHMKKSMIKKVVIAAAAMCLLVPVVAVAGGRIASYQSTINVNDTIKSYAQLVKTAPGKLGFTPATVENFRNGFTFSQGYISDIQCDDGESNKVGSFPELSMEYHNGSRSVTFTASRPLGDMTNPAPDATKIHEGVTINYKLDHYKFVPEDYQLTNEDQKRIDSGDLFVSYGADRVELSDIPHVSWNQDGTAYLILATGGSDVSQADLMEMAQEVISAEK